MENKIQTISVRVEPNLKNEADNILNQLGISTSTLITLLLKQVVINKGIPFEITLEKRTPLFYDKLSKNELLNELNKGLEDIKKGRSKPFKEAEQSLRKKYNL